MPHKSKKEQAEYNRDYYKTHKDEIRICARKYEKSPKGKLNGRKKALKRRYNITVEDYGKMLELQHGVCVICGNPPVGLRLAVDHDHRTGKIRGLLCVSCNRWLGIMEKSPQLLTNMKQYLMERECTLKSKR